MYRLVRLFGVSRAGGFVSGLLFAFGPYRWCNMANLNLLQTEFIPLGIWFAFRFAWRRRARDLVAAGTVLAVQSYFSWYYTFYLGTALALLAVHQIALGSARWRELAGRRSLATALLTLTLLLPGLYPYLKQRASMSGFGRSLGMTAYWSADLLDYLKTNVENRTLGRIPGLSGDQPYFPGLVAVMLAWLGLRALVRGEAPGRGSALASVDVARAATVRAVRRLGDGGYFIFLGLAGFVLSLGPVLRVAGHRLWVPLPYAVLYFTVPGFSSMRASGRYAVLVLTATAVLAGLGYERLRRRARAAWTGLLFPAAIAAALLFACSVPWPMVRFPLRDAIPSVYAWLARQPGDLVVLDLPVPAREADEGEREVTRQIYAIYHGKALVDGVSGFVPPRHRVFREVMQRFPAPEAVRAAAERGTQIVIVHYGDWEPGAGERRRREAERAPGLRKVAEFGADVAYRVVAPTR
jgi:hypothetical protein